MLRMSALFFVMAVVAAVLGFLMDGAESIAMILFFLFVIVSLIYLMMGLARRAARRSA